MTPREVQPRGPAHVLTAFQRSVLVGTLLGDGSIAKHGHHHRLFIKHKEAHRSLVDWKHLVFRNFTTMEPHRFDQLLNGRRYPCSQFVTRTHSEFSVWRQRFYRGRRKIVPREIAQLLTPLSMAVWFMDDGTPDRTGLTFQTHSFTLGEVERLASALGMRFSIDASPMRNKGHWIVYVHGPSVAEFRELIAPYVLPAFEYKLVPRGPWTP